MKRQEEVIHFFKSLRDEIVEAFQSLEPTKRFTRKDWPHLSGGGGQMSLLRGDVFEKAAVNWSGVHGNEFPMQDGSGPFFATGVSLITHMQNPLLPTVHMNVRYIQTQDRFWFGGGYDLTPMGFPLKEDTDLFHNEAKKALDPFGENLYEEFSKQAQEYFFLPHRNRERGVGGIFFDHYNTGDFDHDFAFIQAVGRSFLPAILPIYQRKLSVCFTPEDKLIQLKERAIYAEFNLVYDRGTKFGFLSQGNVEAILCSMPPLASW